MNTAIGINVEPIAVYRNVILIFPIFFHTPRLFDFVALPDKIPVCVVQGPAKILPLSDVHKFTWS